MHIQCPSCGFERDVPDGVLCPGKKYKVTCPRCSSAFHIAPDEEKTLPTFEIQESAPAAENREVPSEVPPPPTEHAEEDSLPPGASIPVFHQESVESEGERQPQPEPEKKEDPPRTFWERWQRMREHVREYDESQEYDDGPVGGRPQGAPWESPEYYGFWGSFSRTLLGVLFHAPEFFRHVRSSAALTRPIFFYVLLSLFQMLTFRFWFMRSLQELFQVPADPQILSMAEHLMQAMNLPLVVLLTLFISIFQAVILAGLYHLMIRMVQPDKADFSTTLRVVCYGSAPLVLCIVPILGSGIAILWSVAATFAGCRYALRLSWSRTLFALLPVYILELAIWSQFLVFMNTWA